MLTGFFYSANQSNPITKRMYRFPTDISFWRKIMCWKQYLMTVGLDLMSVWPDQTYTHVMDKRQILSNTENYIIKLFWKVQDWFSKIEEHTVRDVTLSKYTVIYSNFVIIKAKVKWRI